MPTNGLIRYMDNMKKITIIVLLVSLWSCENATITTNSCSDEIAKIINGNDTTLISFKICATVTVTFDTVQIDTLDITPIDPIEHPANTGVVLLAGAGQSNMVATPPADIKQIKTALPGKLLILHKQNDFYQLDTVFNNTNQHAGLMLFALGDEYRRRTGKTVILINEASNSSSLTDLQPGNNWSSSGNLRMLLKELVGILLSVI